MSSISFSNNEVLDFFSYIRLNNYKRAKETTKFINNTDLRFQLTTYYNIINYGNFNSIDSLTTNKTDNFRIVVIKLLNLGLIEYYKNGNELKAFETLKKSLEIAQKNNDKILICEASKAILNMYERFTITLYDSTYKNFLAIHKKHAYDALEIKLNKYYEFSINLRYNYENTSFIKKLYQDYRQIINLDDPYFLRVKNEIALCGYHYKITKNYDKALKKVNNAELILVEKNNYLEKEKKSSLKILKAVNYYLDNQPNVANKLLLEIKDSNTNDFIFKVLKRYKYYWLYVISSKNKTLNSIKFQNEYLKLKIEIDHDKSLAKISDFETKYQTEKKEKENLQLKQDNFEIETKRKQNQNYLIGAILFIFLGGTIATLSLQNSKRKRKLAEQQKEIETQKNLTLLKEQELTTINAMVEGQEKERKRVAEDLHDNLGSVLATLKLHFENLQINNKKKKINQEELFNKTENLIDEAYLKVRSIAHAKNAGVIANQGLLNAIQLMAEKISSADKIQIEVIHYGLDKALENSLEITIFRIVQELVTNIIKHANAKNATINISSFDNHLNIIVEDDGDGFDVKKINLKNGMGISSIKTRVEHLNGTFKVDATIGKGSSIILDIPIS